MLPVPVIMEWKGEKMARPIKVNLDYFPRFPVTTTEELIEAEFGNTGYAIMNKLKDELFFEKGYFIEWTNDVVLMFSKKNNVGVNTVSEIVKAMLRRGIYDKNLYDKYKILTSAEAQEIYLEATKKRKRVDMVKEYLLVQCDHFPDNVNIISINGDINSKKVSNNSQSKVKESKVKESKVKENSCVLTVPLSDGTTYAITNEILNNFNSVYRKINVMQSLRKLVDYFKGNPAKRRDRFAIENYIRLWLEQDNSKAVPNKSKIITLENPTEKYIQGVDYF